MKQIALFSCLGRACLAFALLAAFLAAFPAPFSAPFLAPAHAETRTAFVLSVYDGDSIRVQIPGWPNIVGQNMPVRILGIDTPELRGKCAEEKARARAARDRLRAILPKGRRIELRQIDRGKYFRLLAEIWIEDQNIGQGLVTQGLAAAYQGGPRPVWCQAG